MRANDRQPNQLRPLTFIRDFTKMAPGSVLACFGDTKVLCTVSFDPKVPGWMSGSGRGWLSAEYSLLPGSTAERARREAAAGKVKGRTHEIQRLIGRSLRAVCDLTLPGECSLSVDCDVLQADGGTRTAAVTGACLALHDAARRLTAEGRIAGNPVTQLCAAVSVGIVGGAALLDLEYAEDHVADVDMNIVMAEDGKFIEVQGTAEQQTFSADELGEMMALAQAGIDEILARQREYLAEAEQ